MGKALDIIAQLDGVEFDWKDSGQHDVSLIAENVEKVFPEAVLYDASGQVMGLKTAPMLVLIIEAIKEIRSVVNA